MASYLIHFNQKWGGWIFFKANEKARDSLLRRFWVSALEMGRLDFSQTSKIEELGFFGSQLNSKMENKEVGFFRNQ
jgi:hypothetical protein